VHKSQNMKAVVITAPVFPSRHGFSRYLGQHNLIGGAIPKIVDCMEQILDGIRRREPPGDLSPASFR
jgi:hypothetical protein